MRDYLREMVDALTSAYSKRDRDNLRLGEPVETNIGKLFSIFAWGLNMVQEQAELIKLWDDIDHAKGSVLDRYGANWGVKRYGASDAFYRLSIKVKVLAQLSGGDTDTVINAAAELLGVELTDILLVDVFPAKIKLFVDQDLLDEERLEMLEPIAWAIKRILAAGVGMWLYTRTYRTYRFPLPISHGGAIGTVYHYSPIGEDREAVLDVPISNAGAIGTVYRYLPIGEDKAFQHSVTIARGAHLPPVLTGPPQGAERSGRSRWDGVGGAYVHTRIKPKRID